MEPRVVSETTVSPRSTSFQCSNCSKDEAENTCSRCNAVKYCSKECQKDHLENHKRHCNEINKYSNQVEIFAKPLREYDDFGGMHNLFEDSVGRFWRLVDPRNYCRFRNELCIALHDCAVYNNSRLALELSVEHMLDLVWLNRGDNLGVRSFIPWILCVLGKTQEAYDFLKWWYVSDLDGRYDWSNLELPHLNLKGEDIFEDLSNLSLEKYYDLYLIVGLFFLKYKVLLELEAKKSSYEAFLLGTHARVGRDSHIQKLRGVSTVLYLIKQLVSPDTKKIKILKDHLKEIATLIDKRRKDLIPGLLNSPKIEFQRGPRYTIFHCESIHWEATPGIHSCLKDLYVGLHGKEKAEKNIRELSKTETSCYDWVLY